MKNIFLSLICLLLLGCVESEGNNGTPDEVATRYEHGQCITLNKATVGKGIDFMIVGDAFTEEEMNLGGKWEQAFNRLYGEIFQFEPFKSYKDWFNVYAVTTVSANTDYTKDSKEESNTFFKTWQYKPGANQRITQVGDQQELFRFAYDHSPVKENKENVKEMIVAFVINTTTNFQAYSFKSQHMIDYGDYGLAYVPIPAFAPNLSGYITHELLGHGFGGLADEYFYPGSSMQEEQMNREKESKAKYDVNANVEYTSHPDEFDNKNWAALLKMNYPGVSVVEGGAFCEKGVWRSSENSIMKGGSYTQADFSPVIREIFLHRIYKFAGKESEYNVNVFIEYDKKNIE